ncbi:2-hydroxychromene-2-carboxylate isomerase [Denitratisoma sp. DHT3]|uniref:2-hydroxychromene-2-carboxylate isomerase n=1 Tax=Denitratisoma sp. DHT3 TaxID=1981880 RepID=UPI00119859C7|nr:2-hydroxychromene-2-carboxylate isomerase [Denitratisoma sp. DHT3]QDX82069.1 2-hydroxychromene-2-carboxylate isomerase [Denitratisoma sp. DHT3]
MKTADAPVEFYFDFSSPYGYLASELIDDLAAAHGRSVAWRPILLGAVFKATGSQPLVHQPMKGAYALRDFARSARFHGLPFAMPAVFPVATQAAARACYWLQGEDDAAARRLAHALYRAYFIGGRNIGETDTVLAVGEELGVAPARLEAALAEPAVKERLRAETESAIARGVFGSPYFVVDGEPFFGVDRLPQLEKWLKRGGF